MNENNQTAELEDDLVDKNLERLFKENRYMMLEDSKEELVACDWFALTSGSNLTTNHVHQGLKLTNE